MTEDPPALDPMHARDFVRGRGGRVCDLPGDLLDRLAVHTHAAAEIETRSNWIFDPPRPPNCVDGPCRQRRWCALYGCAAADPQPQSERV